MAGENSAIWRVKASAANGTESTANSDTTIFSNGEVVLFNPTSIVSGTSLVYNTEFNIRNSVPENTRVSGDNNEVQDMGIDGVDVLIVGLLSNVDSNTGITPPEKLITWTLNAKKVTSFTLGRFGLRLDDFPHFNVVPNGNANSLGTDYGYITANLKFIKDPEEVDKMGFVLGLRFSGDPLNAF